MNIIRALQCLNSYENSNKDTTVLDCFAPDIQVIIDLLSDLQSCRCCSNEGKEVISWLHRPASSKNSSSQDYSVFFCVQGREWANVVKIVDVIVLTAILNLSTPLKLRKSSPVNCWVLKWPAKRNEIHFQSVPGNTS